MRKLSWKFGLVVVVAALAMAMTGTAQASVLGALLQDGLNTFNDNSRTLIVDMNQNDLHDAGDVIYGVYEMEKINGSGDPSPGALFAIFSAVVQQVDPNTPMGMPVAHLIPTPVGTIDATGPVAWPNPQMPTGSGLDVSLFGLLDPALRPWAAGDPRWNQTMIALLEVSTVSNAINPFDSQYSDGPTAPPNPAGWDVPPDTAVIAPTLTAANGYVLDVLLGQASAQDFMQTAIMPTWFLLDNPVFNPGIPPGTANNGQVELSTELRNLATNMQGWQVMMDRAGWSIMYENVPELLGYNPVSLLDYYGVNHTVDLKLVPDGAIQVAIDGSAAAGWNVPNWDFTDDSNFEINAILIPEPATVAIWAGLLAILGLVAVRRRK